MLKEVLTEFIFGVWVKMMQLTQWMAVTWLIKEVFYNFFIINFFVIIKMSENTNLTYYQKHWDVVLNKVKDYYKNNKERLREQARDKHRNLSDKEKIKKRKYGKNRYHICLKKWNKD